MNRKIYIGIDNGVTGTIAWVGDNIPPAMIETPVKKEQNYTKEKKNVSRLDFKSIETIFHEIDDKVNSSDEILVVIERPMINPMRFQASISAARSLEATLILVESMNWPRIYVDSRQWQKALLPKGCKGDELKRASCDIACRLFPSSADIIEKHKDGDSILIAEWARRENL